MAEDKDDQKGDDDVPRIGKGDDKDTEKKPTQRLDPNAPPTHFAIPAATMQSVIGFLENKPWKCTVKEVVQLLHEINTAGTPLVLGPKTNQ